MIHAQVSIINVTVWERALGLQHRKKDDIGFESDTLHKREREMYVKNIPSFHDSVMNR